MILVNDKKVKRAKDIIALTKRVAKNKEELETQNTWKALLNADKVEEENAVEYVYIKLGGLTRTEQEQKVAVENEKETKRKYNKKQ